MKRQHYKTGFTLLELLGAVVIFLLAVSMALSGYLFALKNTYLSDTQGELDMDVMLALESLKRDLRLSSLDQIYYYPEGAGPYQAVSFPRAYDSDGDGLMELDGNGRIIWDETVIYHIRPITPYELVKTTFKPRNTTLSGAQRQQQLVSVVDVGDGSMAVNGGNASSRTLFSNLMNWNITAQAGHFDAYSELPGNKSVNLGYRLLDGGAHKFTFTVLGKNDSSSGYQIEVDKLITAAPTVQQEAENLIVTNEVGAKAVSISDPGTAENFLSFPATKAGDTFSLIMDIDQWVETSFHGGGKEEVFLENTSIEFDQTLDPMDYVVQLKGNGDTWESILQTGSLASTDPVSGAMQNWAIRVIQKGSELADNGDWIAFNGRKCRLKFDASSSGQFKITNVFIGESASATSASMDFDVATVMPVKFGGSTDSPVALPGETMVSDWVDMPIDKEKNYLVSYHIDNSSLMCHPAIWVDTRGSVASTCMVVTNGLSVSSKDETWIAQPGVSPVSIEGIVGLSAIESSYPISGTYISQIFDTGVEEPSYNDISWDAEVPAGATLLFKVRTGSFPDLSDAADWILITSFSSPRAISSSYKRYTQFMAILSSDSSGLSTPKVKKVSIDWEGPARMVSVGGILAQGPGKGKVQIEVDGEPLRSALMVDLEIYKDIYSMKGATTRVSSSLEVDITPRNTGL